MWGVCGVCAGGVRGVCGVCAGCVWVCAGEWMDVRRVKERRGHGLEEIWRETRLLKERVMSALVTTKRVYLCVFLQCSGDGCSDGDSDRGSDRGSDSDSGCTLCR